MGKKCSRLGNNGKKKKNEVWIEEIYKEKKQNKRRGDMKMKMKLYLPYQREDNQIKKSKEKRKEKNWVTEISFKTYLGSGF